VGERVRQQGPAHLGNHNRPRSHAQRRPEKVPGRLHFIIAAIIGHDFYHAGEINHLRSLLDTDDRWHWQQFEDPA